MTYRVPGVYVTNQYQPIVNPNALGGKLFALAADIPTQETLYPSVTVSTVRSASSNFDAITLAIPDPYVGDTLANDATLRVAQAYQYTTVFNGPAAVTPDYLVTQDLATPGFVTVTLDWTAAPQSPAANSQYYVQIRYEFPQTPVIYTSYDEYKAAFGGTLKDASGNVSKIATVGYLIFKENCPSVMVAAYDSGGSYTVDSALTALGQYDTITFASVLSADCLYLGGVANTAGNNYKMLQHVLQNSTPQAKKYRIAVMGIDISVATAGTYAQQVSVANSQRALIVGPNQVRAYLPTGTNNADILTTLDTGYAAAIYCAMWSRKELIISDSMCRKRSNTIVDVLPVRTDIALDTDAALGITFFAKGGSVIVVRDDITTSPTLLMQSEPNITMISDDIAKGAIKSLDGNVIGALLDETTLTLVTSILDTMLKQKVADRIIRRYRIPQVTQNSLDPRVIEVIVPIQPTFAAKYIDITFSYQLAV